MTKICEVCGADLPRRNARFCSRKCHAESRKTKGIWKVCPECGKRFAATPGQVSQRFCSIRCSGLSRRKGETMACEYCGEEFYATRAAVAKGERFCSRLCRAKASRKGEPDA